MGTKATDLRYLALPHTAPGPRLQLATPGGSIRYVDLTRHDLYRIIRAAASALEALDREPGGRR